MLKRIWAKIRVYCYYNRVERNGVLVFACVLFLFFVGVWIYNSQTKEAVNSAVFFAKIDSLDSALKYPTKKEIQYFQFNPNLVNKEELTRLGFSKRQISNLLNYRKAGGQFYKKEDFKKLYFVNDSIYQVYSDYIVIPRKPKVAKKWEKNKKKEVKATTLFVFNPNTTTKEQWQSLGISKRVATIIKNYLEKGGHFEKAEDLQKIYGFSSKDFERLKDYVCIPKKKILKKKEPKIEVVDLNTIKAEELIALKVRKKIAERIVKFRDRLGGFAQISQLKEVYGIKDFELNLLQKYTKIGQKVRQININVATAEELAKHLYLDFGQAQAIVRYRERKGDYENVETLKNAKILTDKAFEKVKFYLKVEK